MKLFLFLLLSISFSQAVVPKQIKWRGNINTYVSKYENLHKKFTQRMCGQGEDTKYYELLKAYKGDGQYLPIVNGQISKQAILKNKIHLRKKIKYLEELIKNLPSDKPNFKDITDPIFTLMTDQASLYKPIINGKIQGKEVNESSLLEAKRLKKEIVSSIENYLTTYFWLQGYGYPNDHLKNRMIYDGINSNEDTKSQTQAKAHFLYRKIIESGSQDPDSHSSDLYVRSTMDTIKLKLEDYKKKSGNSVKDFLVPIDLRKDVEWIIGNSEKILLKDMTYWKERLRFWLDQSKEAYVFYQSLISPSKNKQSKELVRNKLEATKELKKYNLEQQARVYRFWQERSPLEVALFVLETILYNEVGRVDSRFGEERRSVIRVVLNRLGLEEYNFIPKTQILRSYINDIELGHSYRKKSDTDKDLIDKLLGVLFKEGEFSFTYFYIASSVRIYCPDMSRAGRSLRRENIKFSLKELRDYKGDFEGIRYFSRVSMLGKIDMSQVWDDFEALPEKPGVELSRSSGLWKDFKKGNYDFRYLFKDDQKDEYLVLRIDDKNYSMRLKDKVFFQHLNPDYFKYFKNK